MTLKPLSSTWLGPSDCTLIRVERALSEGAESMVIDTITYASGVDWSGAGHTLCGIGTQLRLRDSRADSRRPWGHGCISLCHVCSLTLSSLISRERIYRL